MAKFRVVRGHQGDRYYNEGEEREGNEADFKHLIPHVLEPVSGKKAEAAPKNKAEPAPANKGDDYQAMTVADLKDLANQRGVDLGDVTKKADIIAALELSDEQGASEQKAGE